MDTNPAKETVSHFHRTGADVGRTPSQESGGLVNQLVEELERCVEEIEERNRQIASLQAERGSLAAEKHELQNRVTALEKLVDTNSSTGLQNPEAVVPHGSSHQLEDNDFVLQKMTVALQESQSAYAQHQQLLENMNVLYSTKMSELEAELEDMRSRYSEASLTHQQREQELIRNTINSLDNVLSSIPVRASSLESGRMTLKKHMNVNPPEVQSCSSQGKDCYVVNCSVRFKRPYSNVPMCAVWLHPASGETVIRLPSERIQASNEGLNISWQTENFDQIWGSVLHWMVHVRPIVNPVLNSTIKTILAHPPHISESLNNVLSECLRLNHLNEMDGDGQTLLHAASYSGNTELVNKLLHNGASADYTDEHGWSPLHCAASAGHIGTTIRLLKAVSDPSATTKSNATVLHYICRWPENSKQYFNLIRDLVNKGVAVNERNTAGETALYHACMKTQDLKLIEYLLKNARADPNIPNNGGMTPLHWAVRTGNLNLVKLLLSGGADPVLITGCSLGTPKDFAITKFDHAMMALFDDHFQVLEIPRELIVRILRFLPPHDLFRMRRVCKDMMQVADDIICSGRFWSKIGVPREKFLCQQHAMQLMANDIRKYGDNMAEWHNPPASAKDADYDLIFKIPMVGTVFSGKTTFMHKAAGEELGQGWAMLDFKVFTVGSGGKRVKLQIWDTGPQERFRGIPSAFYRGASGILIFYEITSRETFDDVPRYFREIARYSNRPLGAIIVGNKFDLAAQRVVEYDEAIELVARMKLEYDEEFTFINAVECSALQDINVQLVLKILTDKTMEILAERDREAAGRLATLGVPNARKKMCMIM